MQVRPEQHGSPAPPHETQLPPEHVAPPAVQVMPLLPPPFGSVQHGWPTAPQVPQLPLPQVMPMFGQVEPDEVQTRLTQQPPDEHELPAQHGWPGPPQAMQVGDAAAPLQVVPPAVQLLPPQQG